MSTFVLLSVVFAFFAYIAIIRAILSVPDVTPNVAGWLVWWLVDVVLWWSLWSAGASNAWPMFAMFTVGSTAVIGLTVKKSASLNFITVKFKVEEYVYMGVALVGIVLWQTSANPTFSVVANIIAAVAGGIPTIKKAYLTPETEDALTWWLFFLGGASSVAAISRLTFTDAAAPIAVATLQLAIVIARHFGVQRKISTWV
jgi:hypothetical protein